MVSPLLSLFFRSFRKRRQRMVHRKNSLFFMLFQVSPRSLREDSGSTNTSKSVANRSLKIKFCCCFSRLLGTFFSRPCKKHPREAKMTPGGCPGRLRSGPRDARSTPGAPPEAPRATQEAPGTPSEGPRSAPGSHLRRQMAPRGLRRLPGVLGRGFRVIFHPPRGFLWTCCGSLLRFLYPQQSTRTQ